MTRALQKQIHAGCRELGLDNEARRDLQLVTTGKASMRDMTEAELKAMVKALKERGLKAPSKGHKHPPAPRRDLRLIHVLWRKLGEADATRNPTRAGLNAFIQKRFAKTFGATVLDVDQMRDAGQIATVIDALVAWCNRLDIDLDSAHVRMSPRRARK